MVYQNELGSNYTFECVFKANGYGITINVLYKTNQRAKTKQGKKHMLVPQPVRWVRVKAINGQKYRQGMFLFFITLVWGVVGEVWSNPMQKILLCDVRQREHCLFSERNWNVESGTNQNNKFSDVKMLKGDTHKKIPYHQAGFHQEGACMC